MRGQHVILTIVIKIINLRARESVYTVMSIQYCKHLGSLVQSRANRQAHVILLYMRYRFYNRFYNNINILINSSRNNKCRLYLCLDHTYKLPYTHVCRFDSISIQINTIKNYRNIIYFIETTLYYRKRIVFRIRWFIIETYCNSK